VLANFGYQDGSGEFFITLDTAKCNGCGDCVTACPAQILQLAENEYDPLAEGKVSVVKPANRKTIKYDCGPCKPPSGVRVLPCLNACKPGALAHSW
jgi:ferredoxin